MVNISDLYRSYTVFNKAPRLFGELAMFSALLWLIFHIISPQTYAQASEIYPLAPADTVSPRNTYRYFIVQMNKAYHAHLKSSYKNVEVRADILKAMNCLDLSEISRADREDIGFASALLLKEILDRIPTPSFDQIPDAAEMRDLKQDAYTLPYTEIKIVRIKEGPRKDQFLFSSDTVERIGEFANRVKHLPYKPGASIGAYEDYVSQPGSMIPKKAIYLLPQWMSFRIWGQMLWQWLGLIIALLIAGIIITVLNFKLNVGQDVRTERPFYWTLRKLINSLAILVLLAFLHYFIEQQISIAGRILLGLIFAMRVLFLLVIAWSILVVGKGLSEAFISAQHLRPKSIDANVTRITFRMATIVLLIVVLWSASDFFGISLTALFASAGIAGMAVAFAARETLANFFGGVSILLDKPFKAGDYIVLDSGERGKVMEVGLRSTRLLTRDDVQISLPNSIITNTKIINESAPRSRYRIRIQVGVAYGSDIDKVEEVLLRLAVENQMVKKKPRPRVRIRGFGASSVNFELLCWARNTENRGELSHNLYWNIYMAFGDAGIVIPFPQHDVHVNVNNSSKLVGVSELALEDSGKS